MMPEKSFKRPEDSDQVTLKVPSICAFRTMGTEEPAFTMDIEAVADILGTVPATMNTVIPAEAKRESASFVTLSLNKYGIEEFSLKGRVWAGIVNFELAVKFRGKFILSIHGKLF